MFDDEVQEITDEQENDECEDILPDMTAMTQCDICGEMYMPEPDDLLPFCDSCQAEQL